MEKMKMHSMSKIDENVKKIAVLFPECITEIINDNGELEKVVDIDAFKQLFSKTAVEGNQERYQFTWPDKRKAKALVNQEVTSTLRPCREESVNFDTTENLYIEGDNLEVLKLLQETYLGKIKMIYIDPPYNTGHDFVYKDAFSQNANDYIPNSGQYDNQGNKLVENTETNGRFHTDWLNMMYPRLKLSRDLLTEDGLILISIDDCELMNLKKIADEIFGETNLVENIIWKKRYGGGAKEKYLVSLQEYVLVYCKDITKLPEIFVPLDQESINQYYSKKDEKFSTRGGYRLHPLEAGKAMDARPNLIYPIPAPDGTNIFPKRQWLWSKERAYAALNAGELEIQKGKNNEWVVSTKQYLKDENGNIRPGKMFSVIEDIYTQHGTNEMIEIFGNAKVFSYPKPSELIKKLLQICYDKNSIVLDYFSGSATTAHAVMKLNAEDGGHRKFIMIQLPENCDENSEAYRSGYKDICEIGKERIRRAGKQILEELKNKNGELFTEESTLDIGFRDLKLDSSNMNDVYYTPDAFGQDMLDGLVSNIKEDRTAEDLLFQVMLDLGVLLSAKIDKEQIGGKEVFNINNNYLIACFDENVTEDVIVEIAKRHPDYFVMRDSSLATDSVSVNFDQIFERYEEAKTNKKTVRKIL